MASHPSSLAITPARWRTRQESTHVDRIAASSPTRTARLQEMMAADTGQPVERVAHDINRDYWMSATEARDYGVIDMIVGQTDASAAADRAEAAVKDSPETASRHSNGKH